VLKHTDESFQKTEAIINRAKQILNPEPAPSPPRSPSSR
jgi:hypothetical protein